MLFNDVASTEELLNPNAHGLNGLRSLEAILAEYRERHIQRARLRVEMDETTDPRIRAYLEDAIAGVPLALPVWVLMEANSGSGSCRVGRVHSWGWSEFNPECDGLSTV
ncbi:MAG: hypothetical protein R3C20_14410 [Planctomycetaceae bacterium]